LRSTTHPVPDRRRPTDAQVGEPAEPDGPVVVRRVGRLHGTAEHVDRRSILVVLGGYLLSRVAVLMSAWIASWYAPTLTVRQALGGWDSAWYLMIAQDGYPGALYDEGGGTRWGFFPGLPALARAVHEVTRLPYDLAGMAVTFVAGGIAAIAIYLVVREVLDEQTARATAILFCFLPTAYTLSMIYTDGLFIACAAVCLLMLHRQRWLLAAVATIVSGTVRSTAVVLIACCVVEGCRAAVRQRDWRPLVAPVLAPLGLVGAMAFAWQGSGEPTAFVQAQEYWRNEFDWFRPVVRGIGDTLLHPSSWSAQPVLATLSIALVVAGLVVMAMRRDVPVTWWVYSLGTVVVSLTPFWLTSVPRYLMAAFPLLAVLVARLPGSARSPVTAASAVVMGALAMGAFTSIVTFRMAPLAP
jgi:hypothetical protein